VMEATVVKREIDGFAGFLPRIREMEPVEFDEELHQRLARIEEMARAVPEERPALMKYCFDCATEMDAGEVVRHVRQKPFGYAGDFLLMDWIYQQKMGGVMASTGICSSIELPRSGFCSGESSYSGRYWEGHQV